MSSSTTRVTPHWARRSEFEGTAATMAATEMGRAGKDTGRLPPLPREHARFMPCVLYEAESPVTLTYVSESISDLLGFSREAVIGCCSFWRECVLEKDFALFEEKFSELDSCGATSFIHRMVNSAGLPVWVSHSLRKQSVNGTPLIRGCLVPIENDKRVHALDQNMVSRFVHKLGNHFQLLTLTVNSLRKTLPESREAEILQDTLEKAIELTRTFSDCTQLPAWKSEIRLFDVLQAATSSKRAPFLAKSVKFEEHFDHMLEDMVIVGDPFLLEVAFSQVLESVLDSTTSGGLVVLEGNVSVRNNASSVATLRIAYSVCPDRESATWRFLGSSANHDGMGLSVASQFIEMHGGLLRIKALDNEEIEVEISLPVDTTKVLSCA